MQKILILCPFYNEEAAFGVFVAELERALKEMSDYRFSLLIVNDGSPAWPSVSREFPQTIIHLHRNMGHQKAAAIGLAYAHHHLDYDRIIIMDADGEDKPSDLPLLLQASDDSRKIVCARRVSRQNGRPFRAFYSVYKFLFWVLTGKKISFGNFMVLTSEHVHRLVYSNEIWNHLAGAVIKSKIPYITVPTHRGKRYAGSSHMNFTALLLHGLGAIGVFVDIIASRLLIFSVSMVVLSVIAILAILAIRFFTNAAIPGWATTAFSSMLIVLLQSCLLSLFTIFLYLSSQSQRQLIPAHHYEDYVDNVERL